MASGGGSLLPEARLMQVKEWGYPMGAARPVPPSGKAFSVIHITGNSRLPSAENEATWRITDPDNQNSATFFVNRDGSVVQTLADPLHMDPWANGDLNKPDLSNRRIRALVDEGANANTRTLVAIENVGYEPGHPITDEQVKACARIVRFYHEKAGVPINRETVIGHYQINGVDRPNCPGKDKSVIDRIIAEAKGEDPVAIAELKDEVKELKADLRRKNERIIQLESRRDQLIGVKDALTRDIAILTEQLAEATNDEDIERLRSRVRRLLIRLGEIKSKVAALAEDVAND